VKIILYLTHRLKEQLLRLQAFQNSHFEISSYKITPLCAFTNYGQGMKMELYGDLYERLKSVLPNFSGEAKNLITSLRKI
jgi:hypothetical protein